MMYYNGASEKASGLRLLVLSGVDGGLTCGGVKPGGYSHSIVEGGLEEMS